MQTVAVMILTMSPAMTAQIQVAVVANLLILSIQAQTMKGMKATVATTAPPLMKVTPTRAHLRKRTTHDALSKCTRTPPPWIFVYLLPSRLLTIVSSGIAFAHFTMMSYVDKEAGGKDRSMLAELIISPSGPCFVLGAPAFFHDCASRWGLHFSISRALLCSTQFHYSVTCRHDWDGQLLSRRFSSGRHGWPVHLAHWTLLICGP
jgi:hypothetical protein